MRFRCRLASALGRGKGVCAVLAAIWLAAIWLTAISFAGSGQATAQTIATPDIVRRGEYLFRAADCGPCHTAPGRPALAGGRGFALPFGTLYSPNITPDLSSGIGAYTDDEFVAVMQEGIGRGGKHLYPAMPYTSYTGLSRDDILAVKAYLFSLSPVLSTPPANTVAFPFDQRWGLAAWKLLFHRNARLTPDATHADAWNRGAYLVEALGHCGECHTPRGLAQNLDAARKFAGAKIEGWAAYNITGDVQSGLGGWSDEALAAYLSTGHGPGHSSASGPMAEVVEHSLRHLTPDDIRAMVAYLRSAAPIRNAPAIAPGPPKPVTTAGSLGERLFAGECANCHRFDGTGAQSPYADLQGSRSVNDPSAENLVAVMLEGAHLRAQAGSIVMPAFANAHSDDELAALANFVNATFGDGTARVATTDVAKARLKQPEPFWPPLAPILAAAAAVVGALAILLAAAGLRRRDRVARA